MNKQCNICLAVKDSSEFYKDSWRKDGLLGHCKLCERAIYRKKREKYNYAEKDKRYYNLHKKEIIEKRQRYAEANRRKISARCKVRYAVKTGRLKPLPCRDCGSDQDLHAHHFDYSKPLEVIWLCRTHHMREHQTLKELASASNCLQAHEATLSPTMTTVLTSAVWELLITKICVKLNLELGMPTWG